MAVASRVVGIMFSSFRGIFSFGLYNFRLGDFFTFITLPFRELAPDNEAELPWVFESRGGLPLFSSLLCPFGLPGALVNLTPVVFQGIGALGSVLKLAPMSQVSLYWDPLSGCLHHTQSCPLASAILNLSNLVALSDGSTQLMY